MLTCLFFSSVMLLQDDQPPNNFVDSFFMAISAMSGAGLTTIPMADITQTGLACIFMLMLAGGITFLLIPPVLYRLYQYRQFKPMVAEVLALRAVIRKRAPDGVEGAVQESDLIGDFDLQDEGLQLVAVVLVAYDLCFKLLGSLLLYGVLMSYGRLDALDNPQLKDWMSPTERQLYSRKKNHFWFATFTTVSSFNNVGFSILDDNYVQLADRPGVLLLMCVMIIAGNTGLPIFLRAIFYLMSLARPRNRAIRFILDNPRRSTTAFFDRRQTAALTAILVGNLTLQYVFFLATSMGRDEIKFTYAYDTVLVGGSNVTMQVRTPVPPSQLAVGGFFTSVSTRAAGMNVFDLRALSKANVLVFAIMMYIASAPFVGMMQASKQEVVAKYVNGELLLVYEGGDDEDDATQKSVMKKYLNSHLRWLVVLFLVLAVAEQQVITQAPSPEKQPMCYVWPPQPEDQRPLYPYLCATPSLFDIAFEILSAYGTSGLSMGVPGYAYSLCGAFGNVGKLVLCIVKLMGKHRGLPSSTDAALDGQFHKIHGMLEQLQELAKKQQAEMGSGERAGSAGGSIQLVTLAASGAVAASSGEEEERREEGDGRTRGGLLRREAHRRGGEEDGEARPLLASDDQSSIQ